MLEMNFRLTIHPVMDLSTVACKVFSFTTAKEMFAARDTCASMLLYLQDELRVMDDYSNMFIEEQFIDGEWEELLDED